MTPLVRFLSLSAPQRSLLVRAVASVAFVRLALSVMPIEWLRAWAARLKPGDQPVDRIVWAVSVASRRLPATTCLVSALALQRLLSAEGHASELHIGVARREARLAAHAWVVCEGRTLIGEYESGDYTHLLAWRVTETSGGPAPETSTPV
jgi:hypothetical protein